MPTMAESLSQTTKPDQPLMRSKLGRVVNLHHPLVNRILALRTVAKKIMNGPNAYRSADFAKWFKEVGELYSEFNQIGLSPTFEDRFYQRGFGRMRGVFTESQIFAAFKADMNATVQDFQNILMAFEENQNNATEINNALLMETRKLFASSWAGWAGTLTLAIVLLGIGLFIIL